MKKMISFVLSALMVVSALLFVGYAANEPPEAIPYIIDFDMAHVELYRDEKMQSPYRLNETIPVGTTVYYALNCDEGVTCTRMKVNSTADSISFVMPETLDIELNLILHGDTNSDKTLNLIDVTNIIKCAAGWKMDEYFIHISTISNSWDVNFDHVVNLSDAVTLLKHIAGWKNVLKPAGVTNDYNLCSFVRDTDIAEYVLTKDYYFNVDYKKIIKHESELEDIWALHFTNTTFHLIDNEGNNTGVTSGFADFLEIYSSEFFEENDLILYSQPAESENIYLDRDKTFVTVGADNMRGGWIDAAFTKTELGETQTDRCVVTLITVPKDMVNGFFAPDGNLT